MMNDQDLSDQDLHETVVSLQRLDMLLTCTETRILLHIQQG